MTDLLGMNIRLLNMNEQIIYFYLTPNTEGISLTHTHTHPNQSS